MDTSPALPDKDELTIILKTVVLIQFHESKLDMIQNDSLILIHWVPAFMDMLLSEWKGVAQ